jgi:hypothetical protein
MESTFASSLKNQKHEGIYCNWKLIFLQSVGKCVYNYVTIITNNKVRNLQADPVLEGRITLTRFRCPVRKTLATILAYNCLF